ncbi:MAG: DUF3375 domain-containing protein [Burkholderiales bacterium]
MKLDFGTLERLRQSHPAWRLLCSDHAPLVASFLHNVFIAPNVRIVSQSNLAESLEDELFGIRERLGADVFPKRAIDYLNDWTHNDKGWLRKFYRNDSDEPYFDLTPSTEKAITWLGSLGERSFVGTESRLLMLFDLLKQMTDGSQTDPKVRIAELSKRRDEIDAEIARVRSGDLPLLDDTALKDRFQQFVTLARDLLTDFREVEHNFRGLDRRVRERIAMWDGSKGDLLDEIMGERDSIADSDQGKSFRAFWDFLMSSTRQEELTRMLEGVLALPPVIALQPDSRTRRVHYDWLEAGEHTQRTVAQLSQQLRRFLDDQTWLENRRIMDILRGIETKALTLREMPEARKDLAEVMHIADTAASIELPMERPLFTPTHKPSLTSSGLEAGDSALDASALYSQIVVDKAALVRHIRHALQERPSITLSELCEMRPLEQGLAELIAYLQMAGESFNAEVDEDTVDTIAWKIDSPDGEEHSRQARVPRVVFSR